MNGGSQRLDELRVRLTGLSELLGCGEAPGSSATGRARSPPRTAPAAAHRSPPRAGFQSTVRPSILRASNNSLRDAPLGGLLQKYKDAEAAWLKVRPGCRSGRQGGRRAALKTRVPHHSCT